MRFFLLLLVAIPLASQASTLQFGTDQWLPYEDIVNRHAPGFSVEVVQAVFARMGYALTIRQYPWARAQAMVYSGHLDGLLSAFYSEERAAKCYFPREPLIQEKWVLFVRKGDVGSLDFHGWDDFAGKRVGVVRGATVTPGFWRYVRAHSNYDEASDDEEDFHKLVKGRVDYVVASQANGAYLIKQQHLQQVVAQLPVPPLKTDGLYLIFSRERVLPEQVEAFSNALRDFKSTTQFQAIYQKYFGRKGAE